MASTQSRECRKQALPGSMAPSTAQSREHRKATHPSNTPAFLANLGKATLRGIRRCPQCGIYNGTRGLSCKNKACGLVLRAGSQGVPRSRRPTIEVVKVLMDGEDAAHSASGGVQVFSVVQSGGRGSSAPQMGFVELVPTDTAIATGDGATLLSRINLGRCFLPWCGQGQSPLLQDPPSSSSQHRRGRRSVPSSSPSRGRAPSPDGVCAHIRRATECQSHATPLTVKSSVLDALQVSLQTRAELWRLATESPGPLVQRVNRDTLVVKCHADPEHPLGLLHVTTLGGATEPPREAPSKARAPGGPQPLPHVQQAGFHCTCQQVNAKGVKAAPDGSDQAGSRRPAAGSNPTPAASAAEPCLHFYACVCAFASDDKLDFDCSGLINYNFNEVHQSSESRLLSAPEKIHHLPGRPDHLQQSSKRPCMDPSDPASAVLLPVGLGAEATSLPVGLGSEVTSPPCLRKAVQRKPPLHHHHHPFMMKSSGSSQAVDEHSVSMGFTQWLAGVTERINLTMHYQCDGKPEALVYHIPQEFFNALQHRLSLGSKKRRLPNTTTAFVRNDSLPLGSFSKYTWNITNLMQVKRIFDTPQMPLEVTQSFVKNMDGSYSPFHHPEHLDCPAETQHPERTTDPLRPDRTTDPLHPDASRTDRPLAIRPMELRTFLKVGTFTEDQKEATPFVIEWIPDVLPRSRVGELRIRFQFGHQQSGGGGGGGPVEHGGGGVVASNPRRSGAQQSSSNKSPVVSIQPSLSQPVEVLQIVL